ncbi:Ig-like domain-containing protein [Levilactobacillus angrenensis]|uniref:Ig-like domain-containing protein n=1 Tax=Levilactobacillus angrenensis TaxID=2486020 RepID=A0ABW1UAA4_9LACO|nr:Ig-like domain-containing protein [Levilactobacillus angrenensis]
MGRRMRCVGIILGIMLVMVGLNQLCPATVHAAPTVTVPGRGTPSPAPFGLFGFYLNTGFSLQPDDRYTYLNSPETKILTTDTAHSMWTLVSVMAKDHFQWYQSTDAGKSWQKVGKGTDADLTLSSDKVGTIYYQQSFQYYTLFPLPLVTATYYSRVAQVKTLPTPVDATDLKVTSDSDYLYNNQQVAATTYVHGIPTPANATGNLSWRSSDDSLATVDAATGKVTANMAGKAGRVTVTGTLKNHDRADVTASTTIEIGGGLTDQTVDENQPATFTISGAGKQAPDTVTWHKVTPQGADTVVAKNQSLTYTTPATTQADDQSQFYAEVTVTMFDEQEKPQTQTITTNRAKLTVNPSQDPQVAVDNRIANLTASSGNTTTALSNVIPGDRCQISGIIMDQNSYSRLTDGDFIVRLPRSAQKVTIKINGKEVQAYQRPTTDGTAVDFIASGLDFKGDALWHAFVVTFTSQQTTSLHYTTRVQLVGSDAANHILGTYQGEPLTLNFSDGNLQATAQSVDFGTVGPDEFGQDVAAQGTGDLLAVVDNRREKAATQIDLQQVTAFQAGDRQLTAVLHYDNGQGQRLLLGTAAQSVATVAAGQSVPSLGPGHGQHLDFRLAPSAIYPGHYQATLQWTFISAPQG